MKNWKKKTKLHTWELALMMGILFASVGGTWISAEQKELADGVIRLHVLANSDSEDDQKLKYDVRDRILEEAEKLYESGLTVDNAEEFFLEHLPALESAGRSVAEGYEVTAEVTDQWFPTKFYDNFSLPAGEYRAIQIKIGEAEGENWWCVAYPPLCLGAASETLDMAVEAGNFSPEEIRLITGEGYVLKFKSMEWLGNLQKYFS